MRRHSGPGSAAAPTFSRKSSGSFWRANARACSRTSRTRSRAGKGITVLVVDDAAIDRRIAGRLVEQSLGCRVVYADNGSTALAAIEQEMPHLVLTDLQMPAMDGLQLVEAVRAKYPSVPVILMT